MEGLLHGMLGFFPIGEAVCSESDVVKLLVFQGASGGFGSSGLPESFFFLQDGDVEVRGDGHGAIVFFIDLAWRLVSSFSFLEVSVFFLLCERKGVSPSGSFLGCRFHRRSRSFALPGKQG